MNLKEEFEKEFTGSKNLAFYKANPEFEGTVKGKDILKIFNWFESKLSQQKEEIVDLEFLEEVLENEKPTPKEDHAAYYEALEMVREARKDEKPNRVEKELQRVIRKTGVSDFIHVLWLLGFAPTNARAVTIEKLENYIKREE